MDTCFWHKSPHKIAYSGLMVYIHCLPQDVILAGYLNYAATRVTLADPKRLLELSPWGLILHGFVSLRSQPSSYKYNWKHVIIKKDSCNDSYNANVNNKTGNSISYNIITIVIKIKYLHNTSNLNNAYSYRKIATQKVGPNSSTYGFTYACFMYTSTFIDHHCKRVAR